MMKKYFALYFRNFDYALFFVYIFLCLFGLVMIYSASMMVAIVYEGAGPDYFYNKQLFNLTIAAPFFLLAVIIPYKRLSNKYVLGFLMAMMLILEFWVTFFGNGKLETGSQSWINVFGITNFQPSEYAKLFIIVYFAGSFYKKSINKGSMQLLTAEDIKFPIGIWLVILACVSIETDIGAVFLIFIIAMSVVVASGMKGNVLRRFIVVLGGFGAVVVGLLLLVKKDSIFNGSRLGRFTSYRNPFEYADGSGYQVVNGYYAIGSGGLEGKGLGQSVQKLGFLPEPQTDFIMAVIAEELGVLGVSIVIFGLGFIVLRGFWIAMSTQDPLARMLAAGVSTWLGLQTFVNLGGLSGLIPLTGVTLPFISYGGTSILLLSIAMGILINVSTYHKLEKRK